MLRTITGLLATLFVAGCISSGGGGSSGSGIDTGTNSGTDTDGSGSPGTLWTGSTEPPTNPVETAASVGAAYDYLTLGGWSNAAAGDPGEFGTFVQYDARALSDTSDFPTRGTATFEGRHASYVQSSNEFPTQVNGDAVITAGFGLGGSGTMGLEIQLYEDRTVFGEPVNRVYGLLGLRTSYGARAASTFRFSDEQVTLGAFAQATGGARVEGAFLGRNLREIGLVYEAEHLGTTYRGSVGAERTR